MIFFPVDFKGWQRLLLCKWHCKKSSTKSIVNWCACVQELHFCISRSLEMKNSWENWALPGRRQLMQKISSSSLKTFVWQGWYDDVAKKQKRERKWANNWLIIAHAYSFPLHIKETFMLLYFTLFFTFFTNGIKFLFGNSLTWIVK